MAPQAARSNATGLGSRNTCWANRRQTHHGPHSARLSTCRLAHVLWAPPHRYLLASSGYLGSSRRLLPIRLLPLPLQDRKSTRLNSSHPSISYAVFCLKKKKNKKKN